MLLVQEVDELVVLVDCVLQLCAEIVSLVCELGDLTFKSMLELREGNLKLLDALFSDSH